MDYCSVMISTYSSAEMEFLHLDENPSACCGFTTRGAAVFATSRRVISFWNRSRTRPNCFAVRKARVITFSTMSSRVSSLRVLLRDCMKPWKVSASIAKWPLRCMVQPGSWFVPQSRNAGSEWCRTCRTGVSRGATSSRYSRRSLRSCRPDGGGVPVPDTFTSMRAPPPRISMLTPAALPSGDMPSTEMLVDGMPMSSAWMFISTSWAKAEEAANMDEASTARAIEFIELFLSI
ncbi:hypothetical protein MXAN_6278 [Myxococcus xanthus DK 1622]|uniref:Uncharacterized protein n=1 Tax=Myxococcus xanthus (strain DK1622) TaxID=246197 RepID=Q1CYW8_MYXXD|nr:hypothetical protein MXAN_6278 [Myxococcus xanthus DK 1622]